MKKIYLIFFFFFLFSSFVLGFTFVEDFTTNTLGSTIYNNTDYDFFVRAGNMNQLFYSNFTSLGLNVNSTYIWYIGIPRASVSPTTMTGTFWGNSSGIISNLSGTSTTDPMDGFHLYHRFDDYVNPYTTKINVSYITYKNGASIYDKHGIELYLDNDTCIASFGFEDTWGLDCVYKYNLGLADINDKNIHYAFVDLKNYSDIKTYNIKAISLVSGFNTDASSPFNPPSTIWVNINIFQNDSDNSLPYVNISYDPIKCLNASSKYVEFPVEISIFDSESDTLYYGYQFEYNYDQMELIDDFDVADYNIRLNGWFPNQSDCQYTSIYVDDFNEYALYLNTSQSNASISKSLMGETINETYTLSFLAFTDINQSLTFNVKNNLNEIIWQGRMTSTSPHEHTFYYWDGSSFNSFGSSYYLGYFAFDITVNRQDGTISYCINGLNENSYTGCNDKYTTYLHGSSNNNSLIFELIPYSPDPYDNSDFILFDNLKIVRNYFNIDWNLVTENPFNWTLNYSQLGSFDYIMYFSDYPHTVTLSPEYITKYLHFEIPGYCTGEEKEPYNEIDTTPITDIYKNFIDAILNGDKIFNSVFWFAMLLCFILLLLRLGFDLSLVLTGFIFLLIATLFQQGYTYIITSFVIFGIGLTNLIAKNV